LITAVDMLYGQPSLGEKDEGYRDLLEERTYRAWKAVAPEDAQAQRFLAEVHAMRAFAVAFLVLALVALVGGHFYGRDASSAGTYGTMAVAYMVLFVAALWRMENKAATFAKHVLIGVVEAKKGAR